MYSGPLTKGKWPGLDKLGHGCHTLGAVSGNQLFPMSMKIDTCLEAASPRCESVAQHLRYCPVSGKSLSLKKTDAKASRKSWLV